jgi:hypothetical protein
MSAGDRLGPGARAAPPGMGGDAAQPSHRREPTREERAERRLRQAKYQSDLAYFEARLSLLGKPKTLNQAAQQKAYKTLHRAVARRLLAAEDAQPLGR